MCDSGAGDGSCENAQSTADPLTQATIAKSVTVQVNDQKVRLFGMDAPETKQMCRDAKHHEYACGETLRAPAAWQSLHRRNSSWQLCLSALHARQGLSAAWVFALQRCWTATSWTPACQCLLLLEGHTTAPGPADAACLAAGAQATDALKAQIAARPVRCEVRPV